MQSRGHLSLSHPVLRHFYIVEKRGAPSLLPPLFYDAESCDGPGRARPCKFSRRAVRRPFGCTTEPCRLCCALLLLNGSCRAGLDTLQHLVEQQCRTHTFCRVQGRGSPLTLLDSCQATVRRPCCFAAPDLGSSCQSAKCFRRKCWHDTDAPVIQEPAVIYDR
jgi:hypothetical protein